ncbi:hypothetical protein BDZ94DRAFT_272713 [Collybia nuda]|uniref:MYND-type domain-containing protein n=1 Tax=Collybia nuda TaxID=64659 RepID=A0A9P6CH00_9AGAR|nr:hypothetical protein BDZ94DRAFT_272713 [Collybia nuda]
MSGKRCSHELYCLMMSSSKKSRHNAQRPMYITNGRAATIRKPDNKTKESKTSTIYVCCSIPCQRTEKLRNCSRCKTASYCSTACQKEDWPKHKDQCLLQQRLRESIDVTGETTLSRSLRHFTARFEPSFITAISGLLNFRRSPENVESLALLLVVVPHATKKTGRFVLKELMIYPITEFVDLIKSIDPRSREIFELHKTMREEFQRENDGQYDYATMAVMAKNEGPGRIPGDMPLIFRFKPIAISWPIINESPIFANPAVDWSAILKMQIERDMPCT